MLPIALIIVLGVGAQWLAWRIRLPSILLLLCVGLAAGPGWVLISGNGAPLLDPDGLFGELLLPLVSISVGVILYEGGLTLTFREITGVKRVIRNLVSVGALVAWVGAAGAAKFVLGLPTDLSILVGAILVVTGPTVIGPLLQHVRPKGKVGPILKWESIIIDPIGATLAVLVFEVIAAGGADDAFASIVMSLVKTIGVGGGMGVLCALILMQAMRRFLIPDALQNPVSLLLVVVAIVASDSVQKESGLLAATVMGMVLANQRQVAVHHILEFKENLRVLLISSLFVVLSARLTVDDLRSLDWRAAVFVGILLLIVRPLSVWASTAKSGLTWQERGFLAWMAPRGIVAAAVASVFALALEESGREDARAIAPVVFSAILGTVAVYGLTALPLARKLRLADQNPQGVLIVGASAWARGLAQALRKRGFRVVLADTNRESIRQARMDEIDTYYGNVLEEYALEEIDLAGLGRLIAATPNSEVNALVVQRFTSLFGRAGVYRLPMKERRKGDESAGTGLGRVAFSDDATFSTLASRHAGGHVIKATTLSDEFTFDDYRTLYGASALILAVVTPEKQLRLAAPDRSLSPESGDTLIAFVDPEALFLA